MTELRKYVVCFHQAFRPKRMPLFLLVERFKQGYGDCSTCNYDPENNKFCTGYNPITLWVGDVRNESELEEKIDD